VIGSNVLNNPYPVRFDSIERKRLTDIQFKHREAVHRKNSALETLRTLKAVKHRNMIIVAKLEQQCFVSRGLIQKGQQEENEKLKEEIKILTQNINQQREWREEVAAKNGGPIYALFLSVEIYFYPFLLDTMRNLKMDLDDEYGETLSKLELHKNDSEMNRLKKEIAIASTHLQEKQSHLRADQRKLLGLGEDMKSLVS